MNIILMLLLLQNNKFMELQEIEEKSCENSAVLTKHWFEAATAVDQQIHWKKAKFIELQHEEEKRHYPIWNYYHCCFHNRTKIFWKSYLIFYFQTYKIQIVNFFRTKS